MPIEKELKENCAACMDSTKGVKKYERLISTLNGRTKGFNKAEACCILQVITSRTSMNNKAHEAFVACASTVFAKFKTHYKFPAEI